MSTHLPRKKKTERIGFENYVNNQDAVLVQCKTVGISLWFCRSVQEGQLVLIEAFRLLALLALVSSMHRLSMRFRPGQFVGQSSAVIPL